MALRAIASPALPAACLLEPEGERLGAGEVSREGRRARESQEGIERAWIGGKRDAVGVVREMLRQGRQGRRENTSRPCALHR